MSPARAVVEQRLFTYAEAALYLSTSRRHLERLVYERRIPYVKIGGKVRFDRTDLDRHIKANRTEAAS